MLKIVADGIKKGGIQLSGFEKLVYEAGQLSLQKELDSARQLITDIRHGNYYADVDDLAERWLRKHPEKRKLTRKAM